MLNLKNRPMAIQIWIILGLVLGLSFTLNFLLFPFVLRYSFTNETYARIEESQEYILNYQDINEITKSKDILLDREEHNYSSPRIVRHLLLNHNTAEEELPTQIVSQMRKEADKQKESLKHYHQKVNKSEIFYVIRKVKLNNQTYYLSSYLWARYRDNLVKNTFKRLIGLLIFILIISWIASIAIARYITRPLVKLQSKVKDIAARKWENSVSLDRNDELGELGKTIDWMRLQLLEQEQKQQSFLQQVSHELKTPVMVIRSYIQSINDGIFPQGNIDNSLQVIEEETERLEKRVHFLLSYTKYEYLARHQLEEKEFNLTKLIEKTIGNFMWRKSELDWKINLDSIIMIGDKEKIRIALENIFDNQIRYADTIISLELKKITDKNFSWELRIWNDGLEIDPVEMENIFQKYKKGYEGNFGLGLAIAKLIIDLHNGQIRVENEQNGVAFYIKI